MELLLAAGYIFILRLIDQSLGTLRTLYVNKGKPFFGAILGFIESGIWIIAISQVIKDLNDPYLAVGYALGFAAGTIVGSYIESSIAIGDVVIRIFSPKDSDSKKLAKELRRNGEGMEGEVTISWCVTPRKKVKDVLKIVSTISPDAYITTESTNPTKLTANRK